MLFYHVKENFCSHLERKNEVKKSSDKDVKSLISTSIILLITLTFAIKKQNKVLSKKESFIIVLLGGEDIKTYTAGNKKQKSHVLYI
jgi:hypothetical protein